jgi:hypothetical protein
MKIELVLLIVQLVITIYTAILTLVDLESREMIGDYPWLRKVLMFIGCCAVLVWLFTSTFTVIVN